MRGELFIDGVNHLLDALLESMIIDDNPVCCLGLRTHFVAKRVVNPFEEFIETMLKVFRFVEMIEPDLAAWEDLFDIGIGIANLISARSRDLVDLGIGAIALLLNVNVEDNACAIIIGIKLLPAGVTIHIDILALACQPLQGILVPGLIFSPYLHPKIWIMSHDSLEDVLALLRMEDISGKDKVVTLLDVLLMVDRGIDRLWEEICLDAILLEDKRDVGLLIAEDGIDSGDVLFAERDVHKAVEEPQCHFGRFLRRLGIVICLANA